MDKGVTKKPQPQSVLNKVDSLDEAIRVAVRAYRLARRRAIMRKSVKDRNSAKNLAKDYPEFFTLGGPEKNLIFTGISAEEVLEEYLQKIGEKRCSKLWYRLAGVVVARGEREENDLI